jgi:hypothetical protein
VRVGADPTGDLVVALEGVGGRAPARVPAAERRGRCDPSRQLDARTQDLDVRRIAEDPGSMSGASLGSADRSRTDPRLCG